MLLKVCYTVRKLKVGFQDVQARSHLIIMISRADATYALLNDSLTILSVLYIVFLLLICPEST